MSKKIVWLKSNDCDNEMEVLFITKDGRFRIVRATDNDFDLEDICKFTFSPKDNPDVPEKELKKQEQKFREKFEIYGAVIVRLEEQSDDNYYIVDSCGGFMGWEHFGKKHFYINELKQTVSRMVHSDVLSTS